MTDFPITPPPELVQQWMSEYYGAVVAPGEATTDIAARAAQWGADMELEACCEWLKKNTNYHMTIEYLRAARRPKPPSLKEQALAALGRYMTGETILTKDSLDTIRRALEALPE